MIAVPIQSTTTLVAGPPQIAIDNLGVVAAGGGGMRPYDIAPDGRFYVIRAASPSDTGTAPNLVLVLNWTEELKRLVPTK